MRWSQRRNGKLRIIAETLLAVVELGSDRPHVDAEIASWLTEQFAGTALFAGPDRPPDGTVE